MFLITEIHTRRKWRNDEIAAELCNYCGTVRKLKNGKFNK